MTTSVFGYAVSLFASFTAGSAFQAGRYGEFTLFIVLSISVLIGQIVIDRIPALKTPAR